MRTIYLHIGYHKTATTFLQHVVFPELENVSYIEKKPRVKKRYNKVKKRKLSGKEVDEFRGMVNRNDTGDPILISHEGFCGTPLFFGNGQSQFEILEDLRRILPASEYDVHIIVGIREQVSLLTSLYVEHVKMGGTLKSHEYIKKLKKRKMLKDYNFYRYLQEIEKLFGRDRIYVMSYEDYKQNSSEELLKLLNLMGEPEVPSYNDKVQFRNKSLGKRQVSIARRLNHLFKTQKHPQGILPIVKVPILGELSTRNLLQNKFNFSRQQRYQFPKKLQSSLRQRYEEGNHNLANVYNLDLPQKFFVQS
ncbi:MAG TPA: sulfotransferase domain-containing protein [Bacillales bacterium]